MVPFCKESGMPTLRRNREVGLASHQQPEQVSMQRIITVNLLLGQNATDIQM